VSCAPEQWTENFWSFPSFYYMAAKKTKFVLQGHCINVFLYLRDTNWLSIVCFSMFRSWCWRWGSWGGCSIYFSHTRVGICCFHLVCRYLVLWINLFYSQVPLWSEIFCIHKFGIMASHGRCLHHLILIQ